MYLLDTNVISELHRPARANPGLVRWARVTPLPALYLSVVTVMEIEIGVLRRERRAPSQGAALRRWFETDVLRRFDGRVLQVDVAVARACARLNADSPRSLNDSYIAATAIVHGLTVVTRNEADFGPTGAAVFDPWTPPP